MKQLVIGGFLLLLTACGSSSTPSTNTGSGNGSSNQPPVLSYPYNPNLDITERSDARVPYYGEWVWAVAFSNGDVFTGKMSISKRAPSTDGLTNAGGGVAVWCVTASCNYGSDIGVVGSVNTSSGSALSIGLYDSYYDQTKFVALDSDGIVGVEVNGKPTLKGPGRWFYYSGSDTAIGFAMSQVNTVPPVKLDGSVNAPLALSTARSMPKITVQSEQQLLEGRATATLSQLTK
jgi:hypothetical protein